MKTIFVIIMLASITACSTIDAAGGREAYAISAQKGDAVKLRRDLARCQFDDPAQALMCMEDKGYKLVQQ